MNDASRQIEDDESANCKEAGVEYQEMVVANDALTVVVNPANDFAQCLTVEQLKKIWEPEERGHQLEPGGPELPGRGDQAVRARHRLRYVRLLHRRDQR